DLPIEGIVEIRHGQQLRIGPLLFEVRLADETPTEAPSSSSDEEAAALLLDGQQASDDDDGWSTVKPRAISFDEEPDPLAPSGPVGKSGRPAPVADTTDAAGKILKKYGKLEGLKQPRRMR